MYRFTHGYPRYGTYMNFDDFPGCSVAQVLNPNNTNVFSNFLIVSHLYGKEKFPLEGSWFRSNPTDMSLVTTCAEVMEKLPNITYDEYIKLLTRRDDIIKHQVTLETYHRIQMLSTTILMTSPTLEPGVSSFFESIGFHNFINVAVTINSLSNYRTNTNNDSDDGCSLSDISEEAPDDGLTFDDLGMETITYVDVEFDQDEGLSFEDLHIRKEI